MPGEERKFKRLMIVAFIPGCSRERDAAASQAVALDEAISVGMGVDLITGVAVGMGRSVAVGALGFVLVGEGRGVMVRAPRGVSV